MNRTPFDAASYDLIDVVRGESLARRLVTRFFGACLAHVEPQIPGLDAEIIDAAIRALSRWAYGAGDDALRCTIADELRTGSTAESAVYQAIRQLLIDLPGPMDLREVAWRCCRGLAIGVALSGGRGVVEGSVAQASGVDELVWQTEALRRMGGE